jgi:alcohol dehydrogenase (cytochrome c)
VRPCRRLHVLFGIAFLGFVAEQIAAPRVTSAQRAPARQTPAVTFNRILHADQEPQNWLTFSGTLLGHRHSALSQITPDNVKSLELAWIWQGVCAGNCQSRLWSFQATPLVVDGVLYTVEAASNVVALDASSGDLLWMYSYTPPRTARVAGHISNRGLAILGETLFVGTIDAHLLAINASSGKLIWDTTVANATDPACREGQCYGITNAPLVVKDKVIVGVAGGDDDMPGRGIRGFIAAFDPHTGKEIWRFNNVPGPGEAGHDTWTGDSWKTGGAGVWVTGSYDVDLNLTYWGTGNPAPPDGSTRLGDNLYSDSVLALDADTGGLKWHYQFTPHDDMDWDSAQVPVLLDMVSDGRQRKVVLWANRNGIMYVLDRATGQFLSGKPFVEVNWMSGFNPNGRPIRVLSKNLGASTLVLPGANGTNWFPPSYSPSTGLFYVPAQERGTQGGTKLRSTPGYGAVRAIDPRTGQLRWEFRKNDAVFSSGVLTTASDLVFTGVGGDPNSEPAAARLSDRYFYALDARTGQLLWQMALTYRVQSTPITYAVNGKQYVSVAAGNTLYTFALRQ